MQNGSSSSATRGRLLLSRFQVAATLIVYVMAAVVLWWWYPPARLVIHAGPRAQFRGFTPDGQSMVTIDQDPILKSGEKPSSEPNFIRFWNVRTGQAGPAVPIGHNSPIPDKFVGFSQDGQRLFIGNNYFSAETGQPLPGKRFVGNSGSNTVESPDGGTIVDTDYDTIVADALSGEVRFEVPCGMAAAFSADGQSLAIAIDQRTDPPGATRTGPLRWTIKFFDPMTGDERRTFAEAEGYVRQIAFSPKGDKLALAVWQDAPDQSSQMGIQLWDVASGAREQTLPLKSDDANNVNRLQFLADGQVIAAEGTFQFFAWDTTIPSPDNLLGAKGLSISFPVLSPDGRLVALWDGQSKEFIVRRLGIGKQEIVSRRRYAEQGTDVLPIVFTPDGRIIVNVFRKKSTSLPLTRNRYEVINAESGGLLGSVPQGDKTTLGGVSPDGRILVSRDFQYELRDKFTLWSVPAPTPWLAVFGWALIPAAIVGLLLHRREMPASTLIDKSPA